MPPAEEEKGTLGNSGELRGTQEAHVPIRQGWEEQFRTMSARGDDQLLEITIADLTEWDADEWEW
jgi:hypothetical protein